MERNADEPSRGPIPAPGAARRGRSGPGRDGEEGDGEGAAAPHPIEPSFRHFAESLSDLVWSARPDGYTDYYNRRFLDYLGRGPGEIEGWTWPEMLHPDDAEGARRAWERASTTGGEYEIEYRLRRHDGAYRWHRSRGAPMRDEAGRITRWFGTCTEIEDRRRAEAALRESEERFRALMEQSPLCVHVFSPDGRIVRVNRAWEELWGVTLEMVAGYNVLADPQLEARGILPLVRRAFEGEVVRIPAHRYDPDEAVPGGSRNPEPTRWIESIAYPLRDVDGRVLEVVVIHEDITERRRAEEAFRRSEGRFARFMQHLPGLAWIKDERGRYVYANDEAVRAFGVAREALLGRADEEVFPPATAAVFREHDRRALASGAGIRVTETLEHTDGTVHHSLVSKFAIPGPDGAEVLVGGMAIDITDRMAMEAALREADRRKDEFLATLAHELRNPLAPLRNGLQILRLAGDDREAAGEARAVMERQVAHMVRLIDDLMDVSRITRGKLELRKERVELASVVRAAVDTSRPLIHSSGHELSVALPAGPIPLDADPTRLAQVFSNLLNNAAKYTEPGGRIGLVAERRGDEVELTVRDSGIGIPAPMLPRVFDLFTQVDRSLEKSHGGLGIGLSLVKRLAEMHGGSVEARSEGHGQGSAFVVRLPVAPIGGPGERGPDEGRRAGTGPRRRVLVVDDNEDAAASLARMLGLMGHEARTARDGEEGIAAAEADRPDLIVLDIGMPGMSGFEACRRIREQPWGKGLFIAALTGWGQDVDRRRSREAGFDHHLVKPVEPAALEELLGSIAARGGEPPAGPR